MLHEFLTTNREELVRRCRVKVAKRNELLREGFAVDQVVHDYGDLCVFTIDPRSAEN